MNKTVRTILQMVGYLINFLLGRKGEKNERSHGTERL